MHEIKVINKQLKELNEIKKKIVDKTANEIKQYLQLVENLDKEKCSLFLKRLELNADEFEGRFEKLKLEASMALEQDLTDLKSLYEELTQKEKI